MIKSRWYLHPLFVFIFSLAALGASLVLYIDSYLAVNHAFAKYLQSVNMKPDELLDKRAWVYILILCILVGLIVIGLAIIFIYNQKVIKLYKMQQNFINGLTHELKTPITSIKLYIDTFKMHKLDESVRMKYYDYMQADIERLQNNVQQILELTRIEDQKMEGDFENINIEEFIREVVSSNQIFAKIKLKISSSWKSSFYYRVNPHYFKMLVMNLLINAMNHNSKNDKVISIKFSESEKFKTLSIIDNGDGIKKSELKNVFKKFYRLDRKSKGSGLGLYIVSHLAKAHNLLINLNSKGPHLGATATVSFPRKI